MLLAGAVLLIAAGGIATADERVASGSDVDISVQASTIESGGGTLTIWASEPIGVTVGPTTDRADEHYIYCLDIDGSEYDCGQGEYRASGGVLFKLSASELSTGEHTIKTRMYEDGFGYDNPKIDEVSFTLQVISKDGDIDGDGLSNRREVRQGTDYRVADTDSDRLNDGQEVNQYRTDPNQQDTDGDGLSDGDEVSRYKTDPTVRDSDSDGLDDGREVEEFGTNPTNANTDGDGVEDGAEVNQYSTDPTRTDTDGDGIDDGSEIQQGSDPNDSDSPQQESDNHQSNVDAQSKSDSGTSQADTSGTTSEEGDASNQDEEFQRGFLTNDSNAVPAPLNDPLNLTTVGFAISIIGIVLELKRGG